MNKHFRMEVLISCMHENNRTIVERTNIQSDVIIVNQCDIDKIDEWVFINKFNNKCKAKMIYTTERGLSRSRNMAIKNATADICLICDDDEKLDDNYVKTIVDAFDENKEYDILAFNLTNPEMLCPTQEKVISYWGTGKLASWQIAFRRNDKILASPFNVLMGSGTGNGCGEENKFLLDCMSHGAKIKYLPYHIGEVAQTVSQWFQGYDKKYWINRGWSAKILYGVPRAFCYIIGQALLRVRFVDKDHHPLQICYWMLRGWAETRK